VSRALPARKDSKFVLLAGVIPKHMNKKDFYVGRKVLWTLSPHFSEDAVRIGEQSQWNSWDCLAA
jgi:hypothetical protein